METYKDAYRYMDNAKEILRDKAIKEGKFYNDPKYVRMACNTAYNGLLIALTDFFKHKGVKFTKTKGKRSQSIDVDFFRTNLAKMNKKKLKEFNEAYFLLHLSGGYDGSLAVTTSKSGLEFAKDIINWIDKQMK